MNTQEPASASASRKRATWRDLLPELLLALAVLIFGVVIVWQTRDIRVAATYARVGPRVIPYIVGMGLVVLGGWLAVDVLRGHVTGPSQESEDADPTLPTDWLTVGLLTASLVAYLLLLERAGFIVASALLFVGSTFAMGSRNVLRDIATGTVLAVVVYFVFTRGLNLRLPEGVLGGIV